MPKIRETGTNNDMDRDRPSKLPSERQLWRAARRDHQPDPIEVATRVMRVLKRYERSWSDDQGLLQLGWAIGELGILLLKRNKPLNAEQVYRGWKKIEKVALQISSFSTSIDFKLAEWGDDLVYSSSRHADTALIRPPVTFPCTFCWRTGFRRIHGWMFCKNHLPGRREGRRMRYLAKKLGGGNLKHGIIEYMRLLGSHQHTIFRENRDAINTFTLDQAQKLDPVTNPWWKTGVWIRQLFGPDSLYIRYTATNELLAELSKMGAMGKRAAAKKGGRLRTWNVMQLSKALAKLETGKTLREVESLTGIPRSTLSRIKRNAQQPVNQSSGKGFHAAQ